MVILALIGKGGFAVDSFLGLISDVISDESVLAGQNRPTTDQSPSS